MRVKAITSSLLAITALFVSWPSTGAQEQAATQVEKPKPPVFRHDFGWEWMMGPQELRIGRTFGQVGEGLILTGYPVVDADGGALRIFFVQAGEGVVDFGACRLVIFDAEGGRYLLGWGEPKELESFGTNLRQAIYSLETKVLASGRAAYVGVERMSESRRIPPGIGEWRYPTAEHTSGGGGYGSDSHADYQYSASTRDDYAKVVGYFQKLAGTTLDDGSTDEIDVVDDSRDRPMSLKIIARRWQGLNASITVVVVRSEGGERTHIGLNYRAGRGRSTLPRPFSLREWTYPRARVVEEEGGRSRMTTRDDVASVVRHYQEKSGAIWEDGTPVKNGSITSPAVEVSANGDWRDPRIEVQTITRWWKGGSVTVVVSRAKGEQDTHIDLIYCENRHP